MSFLLESSTVLLHELEIKRSRFLTVVARVDSIEEARELINVRKADMPDARHHCNAYIVSQPGAHPASHSSDDGEPSGTAGRPMLDVLAGTELVDVVAVVTRYFGGTLLGTGGLVRAYSDAVRECVEGARVLKRTILPIWEATLPHADAGRYLSEFASAGYSTHLDYFADGVRVHIPTANVEALRTLVARLSSGALSVDFADEEPHDVAYGTISGGKVIPY